MKNILKVVEKSKLHRQKQIILTVYEKFKLEKTVLRKNIEKMDTVDSKRDA